MTRAQALRCAEQHHAQHGERSAVDRFLVWLALFKWVGAPL